MSQSASFSLRLSASLTRKSCSRSAGVDWRPRSFSKPAIALSSVTNGDRLKHLLRLSQPTSKLRPVANRHRPAALSDAQAVAIEIVRDTIGHVREKHRQAVFGFDCLLDVRVVVKLKLDVAANSRSSRRALSNSGS